MIFAADTEETTAWGEPGDVFASLAGPWSFRRSIDNGASMTGTATFVRGADGQFEYFERGRLRLPNGAIIDGERRYLFEAHEAGFSVLFAETPPRLFHRIALRRHGASLVGDALHLCGNDRYDSRYEFCPDGSFYVRHAVAGPRKAYAIETSYTRAARNF
jgi:hypothetical protein